MSRDASDLMGAAEPSAARTAWRRAGPATGVALIALLLIFWPTTLFTVRFWETNGAYSHGYLILPISLYLVWERRAELALLAPRAQMWGLPVLLGLGILWAMAYVIDVQIVMQLALLAAIGVMIWTLLGTEISRRLLFPVAYLLLAIPIWSLLTHTLQEYTAIASTRVLRAFGVPVYLETFYIAIPSGQFVVEQVCAGLRYFLATLSISTLFAYLNFRRISLGVLFVVVSMVISIAMNWARVIIIILAGHLTSMDHFLVKDHISFGWGMFVIALLPIFFFGVWLQRFDGKSAAPAPAPKTTAARIPQGTGALLATVAIALAAVALGPVMLTASAKSSAPTDIQLQARIAAAPWTVAGRPDNGWEPHFVAPDAQVLATYADADADALASIYIAYYARQRAGAELVNEVNAFYDPKRWKARTHVDRRVTLADGAAIDIREIELVAGNGDERLVWYWYRLGERRAASRNAAKLWQLWNSLTGSPESAVIALSAPRGKSLEAARADLERFLANMQSSIAADIDRAMTP